MNAKKERKQKKEIKASPVLPPSFKVEDNDLKNKIEALLFACGRKLEIDFIASVIGEADKGVVKKALFDLKKEYEEKNSSLMIVDEGNFWKITVREKYLPLVRKIVADTELSKSVMETLAVIAWKSPALQSDIIKIRSNKAYDHIDELLDTGFVTKEKKGRSFILKVTQKFYDYFDVEGKEGIREIFSKIKEKPVQKKVDEFKEDAQKKLGNLKVVNSSPNDDIRKAESDMESKNYGSLEVYDEGKGEEKESKREKEDETMVEEESIQIKNTPFEIKKEEKTETENKKGYTKEDEETLKTKTRKIVKELLESDKKNNKTSEKK